MRKSKFFFALLFSMVMMIVLAACTNGESLGPILDEFFSSNSDRVLPTPTEPTLPYLLSPYDYVFKPTLTAFYANLDETPIDLILNDFYTYHNQRGLEAVEDFLRSNPENALALALRGAFKIRQEEWDTGFEDSTKALEIDPNLAFAYVNRAWYYQYHLKDLESARYEIDFALELDPELAYAHCIKAGLHDPMDDFSQLMIQSFEKAIELRPDYYIAYSNLGFITWPSDNDVHGVISYFDKAIEINPDPGRAYNDREVIANILRPDSTSIIDNLTEIINQGVNSPYIYGHRSDAYIRIGDYANAIADLEHVIELDPEKIDAYNTAAVLIAYTNGNLKKALAYNDKALELLPDGERNWDTRGYIFYKMGKYDEAYQIFSDLIENGYDYSYYGRGLIYYKRGDKESMISDFEAYLTLQSGDFRVEEVKQILKEAGVSYE